MLRRILIPLDGSAYSETALPAAMALGEKIGGELRLLHVLEMPEVFVYPEYVSPDRTWAEQHLGDIAERVREKWDGPVTISVREGKVIEQIAAEAIAWDADLMVMSTHGRGGFSRLWMGSVADRCVRAGACPVLLVRPDDGFGAAPASLEVRRVVMALDGSAFAETALPYGRALARSFGAPVLLLRGLIHSAGLQFTLTPESAEVGRTLLEEQRKAATDYLEDQVAELRSEGIDAAALVTIETSPAEVILDRAPGDLIVIATHGRGGFDRAILGSVTDKVVRRATQPVLVVPPERRSAPLGKSAREVAGLASAAHERRAP